MFLVAPQPPRLCALKCSCPRQPGSPAKRCTPPLAACGSTTINLRDRDLPLAERGTAYVGVLQQR
jgi:hypothetical protein